MTEYIKILRADRTHNGFVYTEGLNVLKEPFNTDPVCGVDGFYFTRARDIRLWLHLYNKCNSGIVVAPVTLVPDAPVVVMGNKLKTDRFILGPAVPIEDYLVAHPELCLGSMVKYNGFLLKYIKDQTPELCLAAVTQNGSALEFVKHQTPELCMAAVTQDGFALEFVKEQTPELCLAAVTENGFALEFVKDPTPELCRAAVTQNGLALEFVKDPTPELCMVAVTQNGLALEFVKEQTPELCAAAVRQNSLAARFVKQPDSLCQ